MRTEGPAELKAPYWSRQFEHANTSRKELGIMSVRERQPNLGTFLATKLFSKSRRVSDCSSVRAGVHTNYKIPEQLLFEQHIDVPQSSWRIDNRPGFRV